MSRISPIRQFFIDHDDELKHLIEDEHMMYHEIVDYCKEKYEIEFSAWTLGDYARSRKFCNTNNSYRRRGQNNPVFKHPETIQKISESVKESWEQGDFDDRVNGWTNKCFMLNHRFRMINHYKEKYEFYNPDLVCEHCGRDISNQKYDIHHVDEDHNNILLTNLEKLCIPCHQKMHLKSQALPFVTVEISHELQYGHRLPDYDGKCYFPHGHRGVVTLRVRRRIDPVTGFAVDFNDLKKIIKVEIDDVLDHEWLNNYMYNPTTEYTVLWLWNKLSKSLKGLESISWQEGSKTTVTLTKSDMIHAALTGNIECEWIPEEYRNVDSCSIELAQDLEYIDYVDDYTIQTTIDNDEDWMWFYKLVTERYKQRKYKSSDTSKKSTIKFILKREVDEDETI